MTQEDFDDAEAELAHMMGGDPSNLSSVERRSGFTDFLQKFLDKLNGFLGVVTGERSGSEIDWARVEDDLEKRYLFLPAV
jgi:hypothetical protein